MSYDSYSAGEMSYDSNSEVSYDSDLAEGMEQPGYAAGQHTLEYSSHACGRVRLRGVHVVNAGIDWGAAGADAPWRLQVSSA
jgi:hypothetical protein